MGNTGLERAATAERFRKDVEHGAIASQHPQIPNLMAYFEREPHQFLVQQFLVGPHLDQCLQEKMGPFDSDEVIAFLRDVLPILHHLHQNRIIHRDIEPTNFRRPTGQSHGWLDVNTGACLRSFSRQQGAITALAWLADDCRAELFQSKIQNWY